MFSYSKNKMLTPTPKTPIIVEYPDCQRGFVTDPQTLTLLLSQGAKAIATYNQPSKEELISRFPRLIRLMQHHWSLTPKQAAWTIMMGKEDLILGRPPMRLQAIRSLVKNR
jgi:hypothetical protein